MRSENQEGLALGIWGWGVIPFFHSATGVLSAPVAVGTFGAIHELLPQAPGPFSQVLDGMKWKGQELTHAHTRIEVVENESWNEANKQAQNEIADG